MTTSQDVLIVGPSWVGDMVMAQSLYRLIRQREPEVRIDVLAPPWSIPLLERMPEVSSGVELPVGHGQLGLSLRRRLGRSLRGRYGRALILPRSMKSALVPWFARVRRRTGFRGEWRYGLINDMRPFDPERLNQTVLRFLALGLASDESELPVPPRPKLELDSEKRDETLARLRLTREQPVVALMPGAEYGPAKQWPVANFAALAARLADKGFDVWILGSAKERDLGAQIVQKAGRAAVHNLCGQTSLVEAIDLLHTATAAVSNDSGLMHVAAAVGTQTIAIYGSSSPEFTPPMTDRATIHYRRLDCSPCFRRTCPLGHLACLTGITPDEVLAGIVVHGADVSGSG